MNTTDEASALFFYDQLMGTYSGHMSNIPNNPVMQSFLKSHGVNDEKSFLNFLRGVADSLEEYKKNNPF